MNSPITIQDFFKVLWAYKLRTILIVSVFAVSSVLIAISMPNEYKASAVLVPSEAQDGGGLASLARQFGGLASLAGVQLGGGEVDLTQVAMEVMKSRKFLYAFIEKYQLDVPLLAADKWDLESNQLMINPDTYDAENKQWVREVNPPKKQIPTTYEVYMEFLERYDVKFDKAKGILEVSFEYYSPFIAKDIVENIITEVNEYMRTEDIRKADESIKYLEQQIQETQVRELRSVFYNLIEEQTKTLMLAKVQKEYMFRVIDPALVPEEKSKPSRALICIIFTLFGGFIAGVHLLFLTHAHASRRAV